MSRRYPDEQHNSLTKSSSWRGAHWLLAYGKYGWPPYYSANQKLMRYEDLKFTLRRSSGANNTLRRSLSLHSFPSNNFWENETLQLKPWDRQRGSTTNNIDIITLDVCLPPRIFISFAMISNNKLFQNFTRIPGLSSPISTKNFSSGAHGGW